MTSESLEGELPPPLSLHHESDDDAKVLFVCVRETVSFVCFLSANSSCLKADLDKDRAILFFQ